MVGIPKWHLKPILWAEYEAKAQKDPAQNFWGTWLGTVSVAITNGTHTHTMPLPLNVITNPRGKILVLPTDASANIHPALKSTTVAK